MRFLHFLFLHRTHLQALGALGVMPASPAAGTEFVPAFSHRTIAFGAPGTPDAAVVRLTEAPLAECFGLRTWVSSQILATHLHEHIARYRHPRQVTRVLELGAGTGLPGLLLHELGASVVLTDAENEPGVLANLRGVCETLNENAPKDDRDDAEKARATHLTWGTLDKHALALASERFHVVLGADVLYAKARDFDKLFATVSLLLRRGGENDKHKNENDFVPLFVTAYKHRASHVSIESGLRTHKLRVREQWRYPGEKGATVDVVEIVLGE
jgi:predicted nicotinamide N-methyase